MFDTDNQGDVSENSVQPSAAEGGADVQRSELTPGEGEEFFENSFLARAAKAREQMISPESDGEPEPGEDPTPETEAEETDESAPETEPEKPSRVSNYQALKAEVETVRAERQQIEKDLAAIGGREGLSYISNVLNAFASPQDMFTVATTNEAGETVEKEISGKDLIYEFVQGMPESDAVFSDFFLRGLDNESNRVFAVNDVLKAEFSLRPDVDLTQKQLNSVFGYLAAQLNTAKTPEEIQAVFDELDFKIKGLDYDAEEFSAKLENERLKAEIERLKNPQSQPAAEVDPVQRIEQHYQTVLAEEHQRYQAEDELLIDRFTATAAEFLDEYGLAASESDAPEVKEAKQLLNDLMLGKGSIAQTLRFSKAFKIASGFLHKKTLQTQLGTIAANNLDSAMRAQVNGLLTKLAPLFGAKPAAPAKPKPGNGKQVGNRANIAPQGDERPDKGDFRSKADKYLDRSTPRY